MKLETRNSKFETNPKLEIGFLRHLSPPFSSIEKSALDILTALYSIFEFASNFEFRISNFSS
jgi:hypothetical protein